jgi:hypothetical protein
MPKTAKKRAQVKSLPRKKKLNSKDMKKVKGGTDALASSKNTVNLGMLLPAVQKMKG